MSRIGAALAVVLSTCLVAAGSVGSASGAPAQASAMAPVHRACGGPVPTGWVRCFAEWRTGGSRAGAIGALAATIGLPKSGYGPADIASAYELDTSLGSGLGSGQTVAIVDAFDNPKVESDLAAYRRVWGLSPCTSSNGCFHKVNQRGGSTPPFADPGWGVEIALDVQAVSAACPRCNILLVEADDPSLINIGKSVNTAVRLGADIVSNSYGADEFNGIFGLAAMYYTHPRVAQVASSGDFGFGPAQFPAVWDKVIGAGGTSLTKTSTGDWHEHAWFGAGSGCSAWVDKPSWQHDDHCQMRTVADVSAVADPDPGLAVYDTFGLGPDNGWIQVGGTSLSSPLLAGMIGLAGNADRLDKAGWIYWHRSGLHDVVGGSNGYCGGDHLCNARKGYDALTGLGSPRGVSAL